jgi:hypothetical protein
MIVFKRKKIFLDRIWEKQGGVEEKREPEFSRSRPLLPTKDKEKSTFVSLNK